MGLFSWLSRGAGAAVGVAAGRNLQSAQLGYDVGKYVGGIAEPYVDRYTSDFVKMYGKALSSARSKNGFFLSGNAKGKAKASKTRSKNYRQKVQAKGRRKDKERTNKKVGETTTSSSTSTGF